MSRAGVGSGRLDEPSCVVIIPAHNESEDIGGVIRGIHRHSDFPVIVVDDASTDGTVDAARAAGARVIRLPVQLGAWGATQTGLRYAVRSDFRYALTMDADGQHEPNWMSALLEPVVNGEADVSIGCCVRRGSVLRRIAWRLMKGVSGLALEDITSGFRLYNRKAMTILARPQATLLEYQDVGVLVLLRSAGLKLAEVSVTMLPRRSGTSRVFHSWFVVFYYMCHTLLLSFSKRGLRR